LPNDLKGLDKAGIAVAVIEWTPPGGETVRYVLPVEAFDGTAKVEGGMAAVLQGAPAHKPSKKASGSGAVDYTQPANAGLVHRGKITDAESTYVRDHVDEVNAKRAAQDPPQPPIDPSNPDDRRRYGFPEPGADQGPTA
jgi:hypothetical protein